MIDAMTMVGAMLTVLVIGIAIGKLIEKIERFLRDVEEQEHTGKKQNDRH